MYFEDLTGNMIIWNAWEIKLESYDKYVNRDEAFFQ